jgi:hypothetical protein
VRFNNRNKIVDDDGNRLFTTEVQRTVPTYMVFMLESEQRDARTQAGVSVGSLFLTFLTSALISVLLG